MKKTIRVLLTILLMCLLVMILVKRPLLYGDVTQAEGAPAASALQRHVESLVALSPPRNYEHLTAAASYIKSELSRHSNQVYSQSFEVDGQMIDNVVALHGPKTDTVLVVGAHYDVYGELPGADDNASGVAGLLALSELLSKQTLKQQVVLVAYALEEPPYFAGPDMGSAHHVEHLIGQGVEVELMISVEMIGYFSNEPDSQQYPSAVMGLMYPSVGDFVAVIDQLFSSEAQKLKRIYNEQTLIEAYSVNAPAFIPGVDFSDHRNYWANDWPAIMVTDTAFYRNHNYHTPKDTPDTLDYEKMSQVVLGIYLFVLELAND